MKRKIMIAALLAALLTSIVLSCEPAPSPEDPSGVVVQAVLESATYNEHAGVYVWVTNQAGGYICTINYYRGSGQANILVHGDDNPSNWIADSGASSGDPIDGVSRATQVVPAGGQLTFASSKWRLTDSASNPVPNGTYRINVEVTGDNLSSDYYYADITIDGNAGSATLTGGSTNIMTGGTVTYTP